MSLTVPSQAPAVCQGWGLHQPGHAGEQSEVQPQAEGMAHRMICDHPGLCAWTGTSTQKWLQEELLIPKDSFGEPLLGCPLDHTAKVTHNVKR